MTICLRNLKVMIKRLEKNTKKVKKIKYNTKYKKFKSAKDKINRTLYYTFM